MITTKVESLRAILPEIMKDFYDHWEELALYKDRMPLAPNWPMYIQKDMTGELLFLSARDSGGAIVGYYVTFNGPCPHYCTTMRSTYDIMRVRPDVRDKGVGLQLMLRAEEELRRRGIQVWYSGYKTASDSAAPMSKLLTGLGFQPADTFMVKWIG